MNAVECRLGRNERTNVATGEVSMSTWSMDSILVGFVILIVIGMVL